MISLDCIAVPSNAHINSVPLSELGVSHGLNPSKVKMYQRYYGLVTVPQTKFTQRELVASALSRLLECYSLPRGGEGLLVYAKTQTHNTFFESDWLRTLSNAHGLERWEWSTVSMNHCASALSVIHLLRLMDERRMIVLLTGEKSFHPLVSRLTVGILGELPVAALLNAGSGTWRISHTAVAHEPRFYENPDDMSNEDRVALQMSFADGFQRFIEKTLSEKGLGAGDIDLVVPYNLNLPLLKRIAGRLGWQNKICTQNIPTIGHAYCSDVLFNLARLLPMSSDRRIMAFAAGMGVTFSSLILERN